MDLKGFIFHNDVSQKDIVEYLGISKGYMSLVVSGKKKLSEENFRKLIENPYGWDTSMLTDSDQPENAMETEPDVTFIKDRLLKHIEEQDSTIRTLLEFLKAEREKVERLEKELRAYREHKGETAHIAGNSSAATAV